MSAAVVVVGGGKAGALHYRAYRSLAAAGRLSLDRLALVEHHGVPGAELAGLVLESGVPLRTFRSSGDLHASPDAPDRATTIVDLCLPAAVLVDALAEYWAAGYRRFLVEKPFLVEPHQEPVLRRVLADSHVVLVRNYLHSRVHHVVRTLMASYDLEPLVCVTNFSKDRRADSARRRGAGTGHAAPSVFEIEIPHQLYIGADLVGEPAVLEHAEALDMVTDAGVVPRQGRGVVVGRSERDCVFVHYSDLEHASTVRTLDILCRARLSVHAVYSPICEELRDVSAGVVLAKGDTVLHKRIFTEDDNMLATVADAYRTLSTGAGGRLTLDEAVRQSAPVRAAIGGQLPPAAGGGEPRTDLLQDWVVRSFTLGLDRGVGRDLLDLFDERRRERFSAALPTMDDAHLVRRRGAAAVPREVVGTAS